MARRGPTARRAADGSRVRPGGGAAAADSGGAVPPHRGIGDDLPLLAIVALAVLRALVLFAPDRHFDLDPFAGHPPLAAIPGVAAMVIDLLTIALGGVVLIRAAAAGRLERPLSWLCIAAVPALLVHAAAHGDDLRLGLAWFAAMFTAVAIVHGARDPQRRRVVTALLLAALAPLMLRGLMQCEIRTIGFVGPEHAATIRAFEQTREAFFAASGWEPDGALARIFERRVRQAQPRAWFPTTNVLATFLAGGCVLFIVLAFARSLPRGLRAGAVVAGALLLLLLLQSGSRGAIVAAAAGAGAVLIGCMVAPRCAAVARALPPAAALLVPAVVVAIWARGAILPESFGGERSLLFRAHYLQAAGAMVTDHPLTGVGPDGFGRVYPAYRVPRNPEEVRSAHGIVPDWLASLGAGGAGWVCIVMLFARRAAGRAVRPEPRTAPPVPDRRDASDAIDDAHFVRPAMVGAAVAGLTAMAVGAGDLETPMTGVWRAVGLLAMVAGVPMILALLRRGGGAAAWACAGAAIAIVVHLGVEMTAVLPGSGALALGLLAALAGPRGRATAPEPSAAGGAAPQARAAIRRGDLVPGVIPLLVVAAALPFGLLPQMRQARAVQAAAEGLRAASGVPGGADEGAARLAAIDRLLDAWRAWPRSPAPARFAARQAERLAADARPGAGDAALAAVDRVIEVLAGMDGRTRSLAEVQSEVRLREVRFRMTGAAADRDAALRCAQEATALDPGGLETARILARLLDDAGDAEAARRAAQRVLEIDAAFELDPLKRLTETQRQRYRAQASSP
ncbi:MAG: hypothetical protein KF817_15845 [Phycisphaeraceae bacterium]|nr:hypothetical protein [Phycisphaeraceae bacterium]